jgi:undecaprenyl-diphosphatase
VVLTPAVIAKEGYRLYSVEIASAAINGATLMHSIGPRLLGMLLRFLTGLVAWRWLSRWLEQGRWHFFGAYCLLASLVVLRGRLD